MDYQYDGYDYNDSRYRPAGLQFVEPLKENGNKSRSISKIILLVLLLLLLAAAISLSAVSIVYEPWWKQDIASPSYEWIRIGLWKSCNKLTPSGEWICHDYDFTDTTLNGDIKYDTPYNDMKLIRICMMAAASASGLGFIFTFIALIGRNKKFFKPFIYIVLILCLASAVLLGVCIGYSSEQEEASKLVPIWILNAGGKLEYGLYFYLTCGAAAAAFVSLVVASVFLFISDDDAYDEEGYDGTDGDDYKGDKINQGYGDNPYDIEREISRRGRDMINRPSNDYQYAFDHQYPKYPNHKQRNGHGPHNEPQIAAHHAKHYQDLPLNTRQSQKAPKKPKRQSIAYPTDNASYDQRLEQEYHSGRPYQSYQPAVINNNRPMNDLQRQPSQIRYVPPQHPDNFQQQQQQIRQHQQQLQQQRQQQPRLVKVHQNESGSLQYKKSNKNKRRRSYGSEPPSGYGEYEMYFNSPY